MSKERDRRLEKAYTAPRDRGRAEHGRQDLADRPERELAEVGAR